MSHTVKYASVARVTVTWLPTGGPCNLVRGSTFSLRAGHSLWYINGGLAAKPELDEREMPLNLCDRPLAARDLTSYRCKSTHGWIMIGAEGDQDALVQARRTNSDAKSEDLQIWNGDAYVPVSWQ